MTVFLNWMRQYSYKQHGRRTYTSDSLALHTKQEMKSMICILFTFILVTMVVCQRPPYAPSPVRYPDVAPRFRKPETETQEVDIGNRNGVPDVSTTTIRLPIDARGQADIVNQINTWEAEHRPFWYVNAEAIERNRGRPVPSEGVVNQNLNVPSRSSFLASRRK